MATVIAALGNRNEAVLLDFGSYARSTGDAGVGKDWALIRMSSPIKFSRRIARIGPRSVIGIPHSRPINLENTQLPAR